MSALEQIVLAFQGLMHALRLFFRPSLWAPWLVVLGLQLAVILGLWWFAHPALSWLVAPVIHRLAGESALRYPDSFRFLPGLYARFDVLIGIAVGALASGASTALFGAWFAGQPMRAGRGVARAAARAGALILANLPGSLLLVGFSYGLDWWIERHPGSVTIIRFAPLLSIGVAVVLQAFFVWVNPLLMLGRRGLWETLSMLPEAASIGSWAALTLTMAATIPLLPIQMLMRSTDHIVDRGTPEMVGCLVVLQALIAIVTAFALTGGCTLAYQSLVGPALEEGL